MKKFIILLMFLPVLVLAQGPTTNPVPTGSGPTTNPQPTGSVDVKIELKNPFKIGNDLYSVLEGVVKNVIIPIGGILCVLAFIYAGFMYVISRGDTTKIKTAHNALLHAAIGTAVLMGAWAIATIVRVTIEQVTKI